MNIELIAGDITSAEVDAIVNAANSAMLGGGGVDGAIHRAAGPSLLEACRQVPVVAGVRCPTGQARITTAGKLRARYVIHAVGPRYGIDDNAPDLLASAYGNALDLALSHGCRRLAFPAISCGVFGYPLNEAAEIAVNACSKPRYRDLAIQFFLFGDDILSAWQKAIEVS